MTCVQQLAELTPWSEKTSIYQKSHVNYSELLQLAKGWGNFISDRIIRGCKKSCVYGEIIFPDMNQICKNLLSDIATFMLSNFFSNNSIANPLHLIHVF